MILCIETSSEVCSVAVITTDKQIFVTEEKTPQEHARVLTVLIENCLEKAGISQHELKAIAVSAGPGSYTGLRIGASVAKGMCFALDIPLISVDTFYAQLVEIKKQYPTYDAYVFANKAINTELYTSAISGGEITEILIPTSVLELEALKNEKKLQGLKTLCVGNYSSFLPYSTEPDLTHFTFSARFLVHIAYQKFLHNETEDMAYYEPMYLKNNYIKK